MESRIRVDFMLRKNGFSRGDDNSVCFRVPVGFEPQTPGFQGVCADQLVKVNFGRWGDCSVVCNLTVFVVCRWACPQGSDASLLL